MRIGSGGVGIVNDCNVNKMFSNGDVCWCWWFFVIEGKVYIRKGE